MLYDANFRLDESEPELKPLDFGVVELIRKNERGELGGLTPGFEHKLIPIILRTVQEMDCGLGGTIMALPSGGDCFYCFTDPENPSYTPGGFLFENETMYFARQLVSLQHDRDGYRQKPTIMHGNYVTDLSFKQVISSFQQEGVPLFRTIAETGVYYDKNSWPNREIPKYGELSYEEAFRELEL